MRSIEHEAISASAGSGKTFQLAHRFIRLMANGVPPDRISALTFSRKAAGEIFESVVESLCAAAGSAKAARQAAERIGRPQLGAAGFLRLLRALLDHLHRLHIGTLDSFIVSVVRAFPAELGIPADFEVLDTDGAEAREFRSAALGRIFNPAVLDRAAQRRFLAAFRQATFGREEKSFGGSLESFVQGCRERFQVFPDGRLWGDEALIWPDGSPWLGPAADPRAAADALLGGLERAGVEGKLLERWRTFAEAAAAFTYGVPWSRDIEYLFEKLLAVQADLRRGAAELRLDKRACRLTAELCRAALALVRHVMGTEIRASLERTRGIHGVLEQFEQHYDTLLRREGRLTFNDAQYLLTEVNAYSGGALLSRLADRPGRLYIDYRLNCSLDHWLLDEFQDTSDLQWAAIRNLADEILQDDSGGRSFFYVGDVKQAIYGWRGGNARLFHDVLREYGDRIRERGLSTSYRSCQPVMDMVNGVFGDLEGLGLPEAAVAQWREVWQPHACAEGKVPATGCAALIEPVPEGPDRPGSAERYRLMAGLLRELDPVRRGLSTAVLVRSNDAGREVVDALRRECPAVPVVHEGRAQIRDNPVVALLLSLVKFAAHPGDTFAWRHVQMSPLGRYVKRSGTAREVLPLDLLRELHAAGFAAFLRLWGARLDEACPLDPFGRARLADLVQAALEFDQGGRCDAMAFLRFIDGYEIQEGTARDAVRVMTIHQSKGLGFDVVVLPDLMERSVDSSGAPGLELSRDPATHRPRWALVLPRRLVAENEPVLARELARADADACFESLCVLYVALTRARQGLYAITSYPGPKSEALTPAAILKQRLLADTSPTDGPRLTLGGETCLRLYAQGDWAWYRAIRRPPPRRAAAPPAAIPADFAARASTRRRLAAVEPSAREALVRKAAWLFDAESRRVLDFGTAIHALFEQVAWIETADAEAIVRDWLKTSADPEAVRRDAGEQFRRALGAAEVRGALGRPAGAAELWREKRFEIVFEDGAWVSGTFDRVTILRDGRGRAERAVILDYKSDRIEASQAAAAAEKYREQLDLYAQALARILKLDASAISRELLFTRPARVVRLC